MSFPGPSWIREGKIGRQVTRMGVGGEGRRKGKVKRGGYGGESS